ncbi:MAG: putative metal-dependent phosphoesterase, family [Clostridia bacterium]|jgi:predicted metal-dependent phosphoesterase TrpH|nr:putative metal-dependent phosphoesterase, family [Clostridia bacterium]
MIDLHVHSYVSDGSCSPREIIKMAYDKKLYAVALTDHDNIEGIDEAEREANKYNIKFLKGIEISVSYEEGRLLHILGLGIDPANEYFLNVYNRLRKLREEKLENILWTLKKQDIFMNTEELKKHAAGKYLDRQAVAKCLVEKNICRDVPEAWQKYLDPVPYGKGELLEADEAVDIIKKSGGLSFLAHYHKRIGLEGYTKQEAEEHIKYLVSLGMDGIERYYPSYSDEHIEYAEYLIHKYNLIPSGGTDFHGSNRPEIALGSGENRFFVPDSIYENIRLELSKRTDERMS